MKPDGRKRNRQISAIHKLQRFRKTDFAKVNWRREPSIDPFVLDAVEWPFGETEEESNDRIREAIDNLPGDLKDIINARYYEQLSDTAIGKRLGRSRSGIAYRFNKAVELLREQLK